MINATLRGKPDAGNPHVRFDEGEVASAQPRRGSLLYKQILVVLFSCISMALFADVSITGVTAQQRYPWNGLVDVVVTLAGTIDEVDKYECVFAATNCSTGISVPITSVTQNGSDVGSDTAWTRKFVWNAAKDVGGIKIDNLALAVDVTKKLGGVQLWENGPYWAECNIGASKPEDYGYYFWWGAIVGYKRNSGNDGWVSAKDIAGGFSFEEGNCPTYNKDNSQLQSAGSIDSTGNLVAAHDAATVHLGAPWRMPTAAELAALTSNCDTRWTTRGGVNGRLVTGRGAYASKSIFLPAAGYGYYTSLFSPGVNGAYWSSTPNGKLDAGGLTLGSSNFFKGEKSRYRGLSIRPVR